MKNEKFELARKEYERAKEQVLVAERKMQDACNHEDADWQPDYVYCPTCNMERFRSRNSMEDFKILCSIMVPIEILDENGKRIKDYVYPMPDGIRRTLVYGGREYKLQFGMHNKVQYVPIMCK
jgi:hypothetical protein